VTRPVEVGYFCSDCSQYNVYSIPPPPDAGRCRHCGKENPPRAASGLAADEPLERCPQCENLHLFTRKDFPQQLGCAAVTFTIALSSVAYAIWSVPAGVGVLAVASAIDLTLYHRLSEVTVCYRCHAELRGFPRNERHTAFDMHRAEEYEQGR
jgi:ribosomal protein L40E